MKTAWTAQATDVEEKAQLENNLMRSKWVLDRLYQIIESMERGLDRQESSPSAYDSPNWDYRQADANGYRRALWTIKDLINLDQKENNDRQLTPVNGPIRPN